MISLKIDILNPKATKLLKDMADLNLISISDSSDNAFKIIVKRLRSKSKNKPTLQEITKEVKAVRSKRYAGKI